MPAGASAVFTHTLLRMGVLVAHPTKADSSDEHVLSGAAQLELRVRLASMQARKREDARDTEPDAFADVRHKGVPHLPTTVPSDRSDGVVRVGGDL
jgi:hypothetical protein